MAIFINCQRFCQKSAERGNRQRNTFCILFWCLTWGSNLGFTSKKPTHYLLDYGDFTESILRCDCIFWQNDYTASIQCSVGHYNLIIMRVCVNFIHGWRELQFKVDSERQIFEKLCRGNILFTFRIFASNLLKDSRRRNIFSHFVLLKISDLGFEPSLTTRLRRIGDIDIMISKMVFSFRPFFSNWI